MSEERKNLVDRMIKVLGFENPLVIQFCRQCEELDNTEWNTICLTTLVRAFEATTW